MKFEKLQAIADAVATGRASAVDRAIDAALDGETGAHWLRDLNKLRDVVRTSEPAFTVIAKGNGKLPFWAFSALPGRGYCPGAGACLQFCYSFRAWRYPAAFARQAQNAWLMQSVAGRRAILAALDKATARQHGVADFRLYVDGDFGSVADVGFWMEALRDRPGLSAYGYSKSWKELLQFHNQGGDWPDNYRLNLSSGSVHADAIRRAVGALPITRGQFVAVEIGRKVRSSDHGNREHQAELRAAYGRKAFTCPGKCGECTPKGHACGSDRFRGVDIIIATH